MNQQKNALASTLFLLAAAVFALEGVQAILAAKNAVSVFKGGVLIAAAWGLVSWRLALPTADVRFGLTAIMNGVGIMFLWSALWPKVGFWTTFGNSTASTFGEAVGGMEITVALLIASVACFLDGSKKPGWLLIIGMALTGMFAPTAKLSDVGQTAHTTITTPAPSDSTTSSSQASWNLGARIMEGIGATKTPYVAWGPVTITVPPQGIEIISAIRWREVGLDTSRNAPYSIAFRPSGTTAEDSLLFGNPVPGLTGHWTSDWTSLVAKNNSDRTKTVTVAIIRRK